MGTVEAEKVEGAIDMEVQRAQEILAYARTAKHAADSFSVIVKGKDALNPGSAKKLSHHSFQICLKNKKRPNLAEWDAPSNQHSLLIITYLLHRSFIV